MALMRPQLSRAESQTDLNAIDYQAADDGYDYNLVDDGPEEAFTEIEPHIWQRHAGGRRAKLPDDLEHGIVDDTITNGNIPLVSKPEVISIRLGWTMLEIEGRRHLVLNAGKDELDVPELDVPEPGLQRRRVRWQ